MILWSLMIWSVSAQPSGEGPSSTLDESVPTVEVQAKAAVQEEPKSAPEEIPSSDEGASSAPSSPALPKVEKLGPMPAAAAAQDEGPAIQSPGAVERPSDSLKTPFDQSAGPSAAVQAPRSYPERPVRWRLEAQLAYRGEQVFAPDYRAVDSNRRATAGDIELRADFALANPRVFLGVLAGYSGGGESGELYTMSTDYSISEPELGLRAAFQAVHGVDPYLRVSGGPSLWDVELFTALDSAQQNAVTGFVDGGLGVLAYLPKKWLRRKGSARITGGIDLRVGYRYRIPFDLQPTFDADEDPIAVQDPLLAELGGSSLTWTVGLFLRGM